MATDGELSGEDLLNDLRRWVSAEALKIDNIEKYDLKIYGTDDKAEHYGSDIAFVDISAENFNGERREYNLVIKYGQRNQDLREKMPVRDSFEREIDIYSKIIPCYHRFQEKQKLPLFASAPKCYLTKFTDTEEVIILENLKTIGYRMHNRNTPMDMDHIKLVLEAYAEWHALSFVLKIQNHEVFLEITKTWNRQPLIDSILCESGKMFDVGQQYLYGILKEAGEIEVLKKYKEKIGNKNARTVMLDLLNSQESQSVVLHADCWNNNFLFKYEDDELPKPRCTRVALLDFQLSSIQSPVFDLSYFIYAVASEEELKHFKELLDHYYNHFASHLEKLGSDPEKLFPFSDLINHFKKYSAYGALVNPAIAFFALIDKDNAPDFGKENGQEIFKMVSQKEEYKSRVVSVAKHFVEYEF